MYEYTCNYKHIHMYAPIHTQLLNHTYIYTPMHTHLYTHSPKHTFILVHTHIHYTHVHLCMYNNDLTLLSCKRVSLQQSILSQLVYYNVNLVTYILNTALCVFSVIIYSLSINSDSMIFKSCSHLK